MINEEERVDTRPVNQDVPLAGVGASDDAIAWEPAGGEPAGGGAVWGEPAGGEPAGGEPAGGEPAGGEPAGGESAGGGAVWGEPAGGEPAGGEPAGGEPAGGEPVGGEPVGGDSAGGEPVITLDCAGVPDGLAYEDPCGVCDRDPSNDCVQDCSGEWGGARVLNDCGECVLGGQSDCARAVETPTISAMGEFESGVGGAPLTCVDGVQSEGETMVDCGGDCSACGQASDETLAVRLATYYQRVVYPDLYIMRSIYQMERRGELVYLHYGFASVDAPGVEAGQDSRAFVLNAQGEVVAQNGHLSGELIAPLSCADGLLNGDEVEVDCGGSCGGCGVINRAELGLRVKRYYDLEGPWAGSYVLVELVVLNPSADGLSADVLYGFGLESEQAPPIGFDSRRFEYGLP